MRWSFLFVLVVLLGAGCKSDPPPPPPLPVPVAPIRGAAGDVDFRTMVTELTTAQACQRLRGGFHGLRTPQHPDVVSGVMWIRQCEITSSGARIKLHVEGNGWTWVDQRKDAHGGTFVVRQYVRFSIAGTTEGPLDIAYARDAHL